MTIHADRIWRPPADGRRSPGEIRDDMFEVPEGGSWREENGALRRRVAALENTLKRVRGERAELERIRRRMRRNSRLRRQAGVVGLVLWALYFAFHNLRILGVYNVARGRPYDCATTRYGGLILEGGGVKGIAYGGAAAALERYGLLDTRHISAFAGTSAGAMMGSLLAARVSARAVTEYLLDFPFEKLMDGSHALANVGRLQRRLGWFRGDEIELRMRGLYESAGLGANVTFRQLAARKRTRLRLSVTDLTAGRHAWLDGESAPDVSVAAGVRASSAVPFVYPPVQLGRRLFVDGGLVRNIPWDAFGAWGVERRPRRRPRSRWRASLPRRRRAVLALSIRGPERAWADDFSLADDLAAPAPRPAALENETEAADRKRGGVLGLLPFGLGGHDAEDELERRRPALNRRGFAGLWAFGNKLVDLVMFGADSPNALPADNPSLDVVDIDNLDISAAEFDLDGRARAHLVASGYVAVARHLAQCGHGKGLAPPDWLVGLLANYSGGAEFAPSLEVTDHAHRVLSRSVRPKEAVKPTVTEL